MITPTQDFWKVFLNVPGALSTAEALAIMQVAALAEDGLFAEFGTHKGKSSLAAVYGGKPKDFYLNDLIFEDTEIVKEVGRTIKSICDYEINLRFYQCESVKLIPQYKYAFAFLDTGDHGEELVQSEKVLLIDAMQSGGILVLHDFKNQFTAVEKAYYELIGSGLFYPIEIDWQPIFDYVKEHDLEKDNNSWHIYNELPHPPNFVGALKRK